MVERNADLFTSFQKRDIHRANCITSKFQLRVHRFDSYSIPRDLKSLLTGSLTRSCRVWYLPRSPPLSRLHPQPQLLTRWLMQLRWSLNIQKITTKYTKIEKLETGYESFHPVLNRARKLIVNSGLRIKSAADKKDWQKNSKDKHRSHVKCVTVVILVQSI